jgi:hypothetical protein
MARIRETMLEINLACFVACCVKHCALSLFCTVRSWVVVSSRRMRRAVHAALIGSRRGHDCVSVLHPIYNEEWTQRMLPLAA